MLTRILASIATPKKEKPETCYIFIRKITEDEHRLMLLSTTDQERS